MWTSLGRRARGEAGSCCQTSSWALGGCTPPRGLSAARTVWSMGSDSTQDDEDNERNNALWVGPKTRNASRSARAGFGTLLLVLQRLLAKNLH
eukprot:8066352-Pyramimonas_sp.AAC.1